MIAGWSPVLTIEATPRTLRQCLQGLRVAPHTKARPAQVCKRNMHERAALRCLTFVPYLFESFIFITCTSHAEGLVVSFTSLSCTSHAKGLVTRMHKDAPMQRCLLQENALTVLLLVSSYEAFLERLPKWEDACAAPAYAFMRAFLSTRCLGIALLFSMLRASMHLAFQTHRIALRSLIAIYLHDGHCFNIKHRAS